MQRTLLPTGVDNFAELVTHKDPRGEGYLFVDKSLLVQDFLQAGDKVGLITRPRRFGKSMNMSMLEHFFAEEVSGIPTKGLFDGLKISQHPEVMAQQGQWPVVFISLKDVKGSSYEALLPRISSTIGKLYRSHEYLLESRQLSDQHKGLFSQYAYGSPQHATYDTALSTLIELLYKHTGRQVIVLVDEYDTPLHQAYTHGYYKEGREFMTAFLGGALKGNTMLKKALVTGILKIAKASLFSGLNNFEVYSVIKSPLYAQYFGFTEEETDQLLDQAKLPKRAHELKELYNGYQIDGCTLYNPWSIVSFVKNAKLESLEEALRPYWVNTAEDRLLKKLLAENLTAIEPKLTRLFQGEPVEEAINTDLVFDEVAWGGELEFWSIMLLGGYLKVVEKRASATGKERYLLAFPNQEISQSLQHTLLSVLAGAKADLYDHAIGELVAGDVQQFVTFLKDYLRDATSLHDSRQQRHDEDHNEPERFLKGLLLGMAASLHKHFRVTSEGESGEGRYDIAIVARDPKKYPRGIVLELKAGKSEKDLPTLAQQALYQIDERGYEQALRDQGAKEIVKLGIALYKKQAEVVLG